MFKKYFDGKKAVFFDLDGTIIDSLPYWKQAFLNIFEELELPALALDGIEHGTYVADIWKTLIKDNDFKVELSVQDLVKKTYSAYLDLFRNEPLEPRDGFWSFLVELKQDKNWAVALISNSDREVVTPILELLNMEGDLFDLTITGDEVRRRKPAPDIYKKALKDLGLKSNEVMVFEDSVSGSKSAEGAGLDVIAIWDGQAKETLYPKNVLTFMADFHALPGNLDTTFMEQTKKHMEYIQQEFS